MAENEPMSDKAFKDRFGRNIGQVHHSIPSLGTTEHNYSYEVNELGEPQLDHDYDYRVDRDRVEREPNFYRHEGE